MSEQIKGSKTREDILKHIISYTKEKGYPPTVRELCELTNLKSTNTIYNHLQRMNKEGMIVAEMDKPRTISVPGHFFVSLYEIEEIRAKAIDEFVSLLSNYINLNGADGKLEIEISEINEIADEMRGAYNDTD